MLREKYESKFKAYKAKWFGDDEEKEIPSHDMEELKKLLSQIWDDIINSFSLDTIKDLVYLYDSYIDEFMTEENLSDSFFETSHKFFESLGDHNLLKTKNIGENEFKKIFKFILNTSKAGWLKSLFFSHDFDRHDIFGLMKDAALESNVVLEFKESVLQKFRNLDFLGLVEEANKVIRLVKFLPGINLGLDLDDFYPLFQRFHSREDQIRIFTLILDLLNFPYSSELVDDITSDDFYYNLFLDTIDRFPLILDKYTSDLDPYLIDILRYNTHGAISRSISYKLTGDLITKIKNPQVIRDLIEFILTDSPVSSYFIRTLEEQLEKIEKRGNPDFWVEIVLNSHNPINLRLHAAHYIIENLDPEIPEFLDALASSDNKELEEIILDLLINQDINDYEHEFKLLLNSTNKETKEKALEILKDYIFYPHRDKKYTKFEQEIVDKYFSNQKLSSWLFRLSGEILLI